MLDVCRIFHYAWFRWYDSAAIPDWLWRRSRVIVSEGLCRSGHQRISMLWITLVHFELWECQGWTSKRTRCFQVGLLEGQPIPSWTSDWLWRRSSATVWEGYISPPTRSMPIRTSVKVSVEDNSWQVEYSPLWRSRVNLEKDTVLSCWTSGRPPDSVMDFRLTFEEGQARLFERVTSYPWQSQCRSRYQRRSKHLEKATRCFHAWPLQNLSLRLISLARFRLIPSVSEGYIPRIPPRSSTRRTITKKKHHWVFQSRSRMKNPEAAAASQQLARYWRCLVLVQATALGNHSETVFLRQVCFLNWRELGSGSVSTTDEPLMTGKRDRGESVGQSMRDRENLHKILERERLSHQFKGRMKLRKIIRDWSWCGN